MPRGAVAAAGAPLGGLIVTKAAMLGYIINIDMIYYNILKNML